MCDQGSIDDMNLFVRRSGNISRRRFGAMTVGTGLAMLLSRLADAADVKESEVEIKMPDGVANAYFVHPATGTHPAVLIWPDIFGLRSALPQMGKRLAESGYTVLVVNPCYWTKKAPTAPDGADFQDPAARQMLMGLMNALTPDTAVADANAFIPWLDGQAPVSKTRKREKWRPRDTAWWVPSRCAPLRHFPTASLPGPRFTAAVW